MSDLSPEALGLLKTLLEHADCDGPWENPAIQMHGEAPFVELARLAGYEFKTRFDLWRASRVAAGTGIWQYACPRNAHEFTIVIESTTGEFYAMGAGGDIVASSLAECERLLWELTVHEEYKEFHG